jgi:hypothetical protein
MDVRLACGTAGGMYSTMFNEYALVVCARVDNMIDDSSTKRSESKPASKALQIK